MGASLKRMKAKNVTAGIMAVVLGATVIAVSTLGVAVHHRYSDLDRSGAHVLAAPERSLLPAGSHPPEDTDPVALAAALDAAAADPVLGTLHGRVTDTTTGTTVWERHPDLPLTPASATKVLTAAAAIHSLPPEHTVTTRVRAGADPGSVVLEATGDVWLDEEAIADLVEQLTATGGDYLQVTVDTSAWAGETYLESWDPDNVAAGYIAPMQPAMLHGARLGATEGDVPRSSTPALDVARALADALGADIVAEDPSPGTGETLARVDSPPLYQRLETMVKWSDNVMAEAIAREMALARGAEPSFAGAAQATLDALTEQGFDTTGTELVDNSGLSADNLIPPRLLDDILIAAATEEPLRPLLGTLPVARGVGTLATRYEDLPGRAWVRAKTGTLTGTNALTGTVLGDSGRLYTFALLSNDGADALSVRRALDEFASLLRTA